MAVIHTPGYFAVVALTAESALNEIRHFDIITPCAHFKYVRVAYIAGKTQAVKPMGKDYGPHSFLFGAIVNYHISIFRMRRRNKHCCNKQKNDNSQSL